MARPNAKKQRTRPARQEPIIDDADISKGGDDDGEDMEDGDDEDEGDDEYKSEVNTDDLLKAMNTLEQAADQLKSGASPREVQLAQKANAGTLTKAEKAEYADLLKKGEDEDEVIDNGADFRNDDVIKGGTDASDWLDAFVSKIGSKLDAVQRAQREGAANSTAMNVVLAKGFAEMGKTIAKLADDVDLLKSENAELREQLGIVVEQPAREPKGRSRPQRGDNEDRPDMQKGGVELTFQRISDTLDEMMQKSEFPASMSTQDALVCIEVMEIVAQKNGVTLPKQPQRRA
jgi:hypothetical protein